MRTELKHNNIDARYLRSHTAPRTRLERTCQIPTDVSSGLKTSGKGIIAITTIACIAIVIAGLFLDPNLPNIFLYANAKASTAGAAESKQAQSEKVRLKQLLDSTDSELLTLVNKWNAVPDDREAMLVEMEDGHMVDERCKDDLENMLEDCRKAGNHPMICSAYRTKTKQEELFDDEVSKYMQMGYSKKYAVKRTEKSVAIPGTSEHQLGLAIDVVDALNQRLDSTQISSDTQTWMMKNSWKYGFILRYPSGKEDITGIEFEPWHYRYLTRDVAREVHKSGLCYEEFLEKALR